jgi:hypothetical protein
MNGVRKVTSPDEELKIIVFSLFVFHYINEVLTSSSGHYMTGGRGWTVRVSGHFKFTHLQVTVVPVKM